jgi:hypothetical protein
MGDPSFAFFISIESTLVEILKNEILGVEAQFGVGRRVFLRDIPQNQKFFDAWIDLG